MPTKAELEVENTSLKAQLAQRPSQPEPSPQVLNETYPRGEVLFSEAKGQTCTVKLLNDARQGYSLVIEYPDGSCKVKKVSGSDEARTVIGNIRDGKFAEGD